MYCALIGLIIGFILGILTMKFKTHRLYHQNILQKNILQKNTKKLTEYQNELNNYFNTNIKLLDTLANNYHQLYQHIVNSSNILLTDQNIHNIKKDPFRHSNNNYNSINDGINKTSDYTEIQETNQLLTQAPRDYPENNNHIK